MAMFKLFVLLGLITSYTVGQTLSLDDPRGAGTGMTSGASPQNPVGHQDRALQTPKRSPQVGDRHRRLPTKLLTYDDVCRIFVRNFDGSFQTSDDTRVIVFSDVNRSKKTQTAVKEGLVLKYSNLLRKLGAHDDDMDVPSDSSHFMVLLGLLWQYDQNPTAYQNGQRFDIDPSNVFGVLRAANFLFSNNDLGFFHALLKNCASIIFDPTSLQTRDAEGNLVLPLPYGVYQKALPFADASFVSAFFKALEKFTLTKRFSDLNQRLLFILLAPVEKQCIAWTILKALQNLNEHDCKILSSFNERLIPWRDVQPNQPVLQGNIVVSPTGLADNTQAIDAFFAQNPDKTLIVDFGNAAEIGVGFTVPQNIKRLIIVGEQITKVGDNFLYSCRGLTKLTLPQNLKKVGNYFLAYCYHLKELTLPESLTEVGNNFLTQCDGLKELTLSQEQEEMLRRQLNVLREHILQVYIQSLIYR